MTYTPTSVTCKKLSSNIQRKILGHHIVCHFISFAVIQLEVIRSSCQYTVMQTFVDHFLTRSKIPLHTTIDCSWGVVPETFTLRYFDTLFYVISSHSQSNQQYFIRSSSQDTVVQTFFDIFSKTKKYIEKPPSYL